MGIPAEVEGDILAVVVVVGILAAAGAILAAAEVTLQ